MAIHRHESALMKNTFVRLLPVLVMLLPSLAHGVKYEGEYSPAWSPDGQHLAYHKNSDQMSWDIVIKNVATGQVEQITKNDGMDVDASWSPDGSKLVFASTSKGNWDIHLYDLKTKALTVLIEHQGKDISPKWSPDGKSIMFLSARNGDQQLYLMDVHSKKVEQLTDTGKNINHPSWSSDGQYIQFDQYFKYQYGEGGRSKIYQLNMADKKVSHLFSQQGSSIAAKRLGGQLYVSNNKRGNWDIYQVDLDTGKVTALTNGTTNEMKATIFKGKKMAYSGANAAGVAEVKIEKL